MWKETTDINQIASAKRRFFSPFFESDSCLTESDKAERSVRRQASWDVEYCLIARKETIISYVLGRLVRYRISFRQFITLCFGLFVENFPVAHLADKFYHSVCAHNSPPPDPVLGQLISIHTIASYFFGLF